ncbi:uncharacterized protein LOC106181194 isoform X2 [Lingula anatina]|uniref:Uncharacterized protein LOC106181194 isoform X2 n=1 Tax=Lingula anatina TaxID=7574 RepID=A0A1S3KEN8_LINAN|nr:uncharacterized protein LOC106181194 isoform X2 [Lingula anatina]|eukprot:XP_013420967.1 uncharacterized protein LOC106181194 isoform X2 [Lingula anatina]
MLESCTFFRHSTWEPEENILDVRLIEEYEEKIRLGLKPGYRKGRGRPKATVLAVPVRPVPYPTLHVNLPPRPTARVARPSQLPLIHAPKKRLLNIYNLQASQMETHEQTTTPEEARDERRSFGDNVEPQMNDCFKSRISIFHEEKSNAAIAADDRTYAWVAGTGEWGHDHTTENQLGYSVRDSYSGRWSPQDPNLLTPPTSESPASSVNGHEDDDVFAFQANDWTSQAKRAMELDVTVTDVTCNALTVTFLESPTSEGFFKDGTKMS